MSYCIKVVQDDDCGAITGEMMVDIPLLKDQRDALLTSIDDAGDFALGLMIEKALDAK